MGEKYLRGKINSRHLGSKIFILFCAIIFILFMNRFNFIFAPNDSVDFGVKENVKYAQSGVFQLVRSFIEHVSFNFVVPIFFVILSLGFDKLFNQNTNWKIAFVIGLFSVLIMTFGWELKKSPIEWIEISYDLGSVLTSYFFCHWMLKESDLKSKQISKKEKRIN